MTEIDLEPKMNQVKEASVHNNSTKIKTSSMISSRGSNQHLIELETQALLSQPDGKEKNYMSKKINRNFLYL